jgi:hypothetical protein
MKDSFKWHPSAGGKAEFAAGEATRSNVILTRQFSKSKKQVVRFRANRISASRMYILKKVHHGFEWVSWNFPQRRIEMQEKELYQQILGLTSPWYVSEVKLDMANQQVNVVVAHRREITSKST